MIASDKIERLPVSSLRLHEAAELIPRMRPDEWGAFLADVNRDGILEPIVVQKGGVVLDGRHRLDAVKARGDETIPARLVDLSEKDQAVYVIRAAILRRHLSDDQRAILAARVESSMKRAMQHERAKKAGEAGGRGRSSADSLRGNVPHKLLPKVPGVAVAKHCTTTPKRPERSRDVVAKNFNVSREKVKDSGTIEKKAPELASKVLAGDVTLAEAKREVRKKERAEGPLSVTDEVKNSPAGRWRKWTNDLLLVATSVTAAGGMKKLAKQWDSAQRKRYATLLRDLIAKFQKFLSELESMQ